MVARHPDEAARVATPLELFFDLCFVVAVAQAAAQLHHAIAHGHAAVGLFSFVLVFFAIWWAWMNFTWFASAYDIDDVPYRLKILVQITGVLVIAAGVPRAFVHRDYTVVTVGYAIMRAGLVACWWRAARSDDHPDRRRTARRYVTGLLICEALWILLAILPAKYWLYGWCIAMPVELATPVWAERASATTWHPHHIAERYGLLALIVLGESVLASTLAIQTALDGGHASADLFATIFGAIAIVFSAWWLYFDHPYHLERTSLGAFVWGYGHFFIFASLAAIGAGIAAVTDFLVGRAHGSTTTFGLAIAIPCAIYIVALWTLSIRPTKPRGAISFAFGLAAALVMLASFTPFSVPVIGVVMSSLVAFTIVSR